VSKTSHLDQQQPELSPASTSFDYARRKVIEYGRWQSKLTKGVHMMDPTTADIADEL
jgi:hypothetical protein